MEGNTMFFSQESIIGTDELGIGAGFSVGGKLVSKNKKWIGEFVLGIGRNFINVDIVDKVYPRFGISVGRRF